MAKSKALFIGGTGTISTAIVEVLSKKDEWEVWLLNRGNRAAEVPANVHQSLCDISDEEDAKKKAEAENAPEEVKEESGHDAE